ncbi:MAG: hypothetical protein HYY25_02170 [Candidatus Wallbacteria bacterium]|nr:hypothetical protein [Candidatus Wallbacteria bacterium]
MSLKSFLILPILFGIPAGLAMAEGPGIMTQEAAAYLPPRGETPAMQAAMDRILRGHNGEAVLTDLRTGERWISGGVKARMAYNAASTFKLLTAYYGLNHGLIDPDGTLQCKPFRYGGKYIRCWHSGGHNEIDIRRALAISCNGLFYTVGLLADSEATQLERLAQAVGYVPADTRTTKPELFGHGDGWYVSPLAQARMLGALATAGTNLPGGVEIPPVFTDVGAVQVIREGMRRCLIEGSAKHADIADLPMAGKTGTLGKQGWFLTFAPYEKPEVTCVVHLDHEWGHQAASVAKRILQAYQKYRSQSPEQFAKTIQSLEGRRVLASRRSHGRKVASRKSRAAGKSRTKAKQPIAQKVAKNTVVIRVD